MRKWTGKHKINNSYLIISFLQKGKFIKQTRSSETVCGTANTQTFYFLRLYQICSSTNCGQQNAARQITSCYYQIKDLCSRTTDGVWRTVNSRLLNIMRLAGTVNVKRGVRPLSKGQKREVPVGTNPATQQAADQDAAYPNPRTEFVDRRTFFHTSLQYGSSLTRELTVHTEGYRPVTSVQVGSSRGIRGFYLRCLR